MNHSVRGVLFALLGFALFSTHDAIIKHLGGSYSAFQIIFFRTLMSFPVVTVMLMRDRTDANLIPKHPWWIALRICSDMTAGAGAFYAFSVLPLAQVYAMLFASPLLITVLAIPILGERVRLRRGIAVITGLVGVLIVLRPGAEPIGLGHIAAMISALGGATSSIISRKIGQEERSAVILLYPMMANFLVMGALMPVVYLPMPVIDLGGMALIALFAILAGLCMIAAYRTAEAMMVAPMQYSQIIWAALYGYLFFGERIDATTALGIAVIVASGLYIVFRESRATVSENRPALNIRARPDTGPAARFPSLFSRGRARP
ncbi:DMT family transporter [Solirhodobacter olei]|uniref:DMT family transporter n=1 Tax=Solirhodobacter olei TaxID=2493082 RepID=UPI000FDC5A16|nr:DMT family transporter [Solirhodobacter olei]